MNSSTTTRSASEWRGQWPVVATAMLGYSAMALLTFGFSPFVPSIEREFGWTRAEVLTGVSIASFVGVFLNILVGLTIDRFGSRRVGIAGLIWICGSFAALSTASENRLYWYFLWLLVAIGVVLVQSTVWTRVVALRFDKSRGLALAFVLSGVPVGAIILPILGTMFVDAVGWRRGLIGVAAVWLIAALPAVILYFFDRPRTPASSIAPEATEETGLPGYSLKEGIRTRAFCLLLTAFICLTFYNMSIAMHLLPILETSSGGSPDAAKLASLLGVAGLIARLSVGFVLDRYPAHIVGALVLLLPVIGSILVLIGQNDLVLLAIAVIAFGAAVGAEMDVAIFIATRQFGLKAFGGLFSLIITSGAFAGAVAPIVTGWMYDQRQAYDSMLMLIIFIMIIGSAAIWRIGPVGRGVEGDRARVARTSG